MAAATVAGRSAFLRPICRTATTAARTNLMTPRRRISVSFSSPSVRPNSFTLHQARISSPFPSPFRMLRRELSSLHPVHSAIASACLVSKLPTEVTTSCEGRFANYLSPI